MDVKQLIRDARLPEATERVCLRADLVAEYERTERELAAAQTAAGDSLAGKAAEVRDLEGKLTALREQMKDSTLTFTLRALSSPRYQALMEKHPPRIVDDKVNPRDRRFLVNIDTFFPALTRASTVSPDLDDEDWRILIGDDEEEAARREQAGELVEDGKLTDTQVETLYTTAWNLNKKDVNLPF